MRARAWAVAALLLSTACSLPLPRDVHQTGEVAGHQREQGPLLVIPPGPRAGASPVQTVLGFLGAQASSDRRHAIARGFLTGRERVRWRDDVEVQVYDPDHLELVLRRGEPGVGTVVRVSARVLGVVRADGSYAARASTVTEDYRLVQVAGQWRLDEVPPGLRLTAADRQRAFAARSVYYLAPSVGNGGRRLVPDQVLLPVGQDLARTLVSRLLRPPSASLAGSVSTAVPEGTGLRGVSRSSSGVVTVDLVGAKARPAGQAAQDLSAQLVWTLRSLGSSFRGLRLRLDGKQLAVSGEGAVQDAGDWDVYDPDGLSPDTPYYFVSKRRLRASGPLPESPATRGELDVDAVAVTTDRLRVALLEQGRGGSTAVRVGPLSGRSFPVVVRGTRLSSPTWGSAAHGLWLLRDGREVVRVARPGLVPVTVLGMPAGRLTHLAVARDGVRLALVAGGRLYVGRVELVSGVPRIVDLSPALPALHGVTSVAWGSSTELVAVGVLSRSVQVLRLAVDGSAVQAVNTGGLEPAAVAASPAGVVVLAGTRLYDVDGGILHLVRSDAAAAPVYPG